MLPHGLDHEGNNQTQLPLSRLLSDPLPRHRAVLNKNAPEPTMFVPRHRGVQWRASTHANPASISWGFVKSDTRWGVGCLDGDGRRDISTAGETCLVPVYSANLLASPNGLKTVTCLRLLIRKLKVTDPAVLKVATTCLSVPEFPTRAVFPSRKPDTRAPSRPSTAEPAVSSRLPLTMIPPRRPRRPSFPRSSAATWSSSWHA
ncbi:hypothetical protein N657DRAFT_282512 [Parathielavia appendiculata]|uniref:Uncharacterized protein n=1 Tax=Parathielavia appendiculata TaxID=2587402 RepID=A0AAN6Z5F2_9PEZI|nr:hypothetical protein N657DRAFT_282512 [Parathielavia appendiculata]